MKLIVGFRINERGLFLDLEDQFAAIGVNRATGDVLLDEGFGDERFNSAAILISNRPRFVLTDLDSGVEVQIEYGSASRRTHSLGQTTDRESASRWVNSANSVFDRLFLATVEHESMLISSSK